MWFLVFLHFLLGYFLGSNLVKTPQRFGKWFQRYKQLKDWTNNKKQKKLSALFGCILKTLFASSDSFCLITSHIGKKDQQSNSAHAFFCHISSAVVGMFFPYRHVGIIWSRRRHACRHNSSFKIEWNTRRKTVKTKVSRIIHAYIISLPSYIFIKALNLL